jgi:hypothetical protein
LLARLATIAKNTMHGRREAAPPTGTGFEVAFEEIEITAAQ